MYMFLSYVGEQANLSDFTGLVLLEVIPRLRDQGIVASAWVDNEENARAFIQGWSNEPPDGGLEEVLGLMGWKAATTTFRSLSDFIGGVGLPAGQVTVCDMPYNKHQIPAPGAKMCPQLHAFSDDHRITLCAVCGGQLS